MGLQASAVRATGPAARPAHSSAHLVQADLDAAVPRLFLLGGCDPAYPFVSRQRGDGGPETADSGTGFDGLPQVERKPVDRAARGSSLSHALAASRPMSSNVRLERINIDHSVLFVRHSPQRLVKSTCRPVAELRSYPGLRASPFTGSLEQHRSASTASAALAAVRCMRWLGIITSQRLRELPRLEQSRRSTRLQRLAGAL